LRALLAVGARLDQLEAIAPHRFKRFAARERTHLEARTRHHRSGQPANCTQSNDRNSHSPSP
jgi:hypothetical protein